MGNHKERTGKTRAGILLNKVGDIFPDIANIAITAATSGNPLKALGGAVRDALLGKVRTGNADEIKKAQSMLDEMKVILDYDEKENIEVTKRWALDMNGDSWLSKNIRPMVLIFLLVLMTVVVIWDSATHGVITQGQKDIADSFSVDIKYVKLLSDLLWIVFLAYFGGRTLEKTLNRK